MPGTSDRNVLELQAKRLRRFIYEFQTTNAKSPSQREMCGALHISTETVAACLNLLEAQGKIRRERGRVRQVWVIKKRQHA